MQPEKPGWTFNRRFEEAAQRFPDRVAFRLKIPGGYREVSYREAQRRILGVARGLLGLGLHSGARVAVLSENRPEWVLAYLGSFFAGTIAVPLDAQISPPEWRRLLDDSQSEVVFVSEHLLPRLQEALGDSALARRVICMDSLGGDHDAWKDLEGFVNWGWSISPPPQLPTIDLADVAVIIYTSGTTGHPKGVMLTHGNIAGEQEAIFHVVHLDENDSFLGLLPLQHVLSSIISVLTPLSIGACITFVDTLKRAEILAALEEAGITVVPTVPQFFYLFHKRIEEELKKKSAIVRRVFQGLKLLNRFAQRNLGLNLGKRLFISVHKSFGHRMRLFVAGGSAFDPNVAQDFFDFGFTILQGYGLTETTGACTVTRPENNVIGSVGPALHACEISIDRPDDTGVGEVLIRGPVVMKGYYNNLAMTAEVMRDGWFCSGDLGRLDRNGNLFITGRKKEVIVLPNGKNIYPDEIEGHYLQCPFIQEIAVLGIKDPSEHATSERLHAVVVPNFDYLKAQKISNTKEILRDQIAKYSNQLPAYKRLNSYEIRKDPLPRTTTRKIKRLQLKKEIEAGASQQARGPADTPAPASSLPESLVALEVVRCLREDYKRDQPLGLETNLELDLGFDSMEKVELLASLEQSLNLTLPGDFAADVFSIQDLLLGLERVAGSGGSGGASRQNWSDLLSEESLRQDPELQVKFSGTLLSLVKFIVFRLIYLVFRVLLRLRVEGLENLPASGTFLICPNHLSILDVFVALTGLPYRIVRRVFFVGDAPFFRGWIMRLIAHLGDVTPVDPDAHLLHAMKVGALGLRRGRILCIFPEGARSFDGELKEFKKGAVILSSEVGVPIVPVAIRGTYEVWARDSMRIRLHPVSVAFGRPLHASVGDEGSPYQRDTDRLREAVAELIRSRV